MGHNNQTRDYLKGGRHDCKFGRRERARDARNSSRNQPWSERMTTVVTSIFIDEGYVFLESKDGQQDIRMPITVLRRNLTLRRCLIKPGDIIECQVQINDRGDGLRVTKAYSITSPIRVI